VLKQPPSHTAPLVVGAPGPGQSRDGKENGGGGPNRSNPQKGKGVLESMWAAQRAFDEDDEDDEALLDEVAKDAAELAEVMPRLRAVVGELPSQEALEELLRRAKFDLEEAATMYFDNVSAATDVSTEASADAPLGVAGSSSSSSTALVVQPPGTPRPDPTPLGVVVAPPFKSHASPAPAGGPDASPTPAAAVPPEVDPTEEEGERATTALREAADAGDLEGVMAALAAGVADRTNDASSSTCAELSFLAPSPLVSTGDATPRSWVGKSRCLDFDQIKALGLLQIVLAMGFGGQLYEVCVIVKPAAAASKRSQSPKQAVIAVRVEAADQVRDFDELLEALKDRHNVVSLAPDKLRIEFVDGQPAVFTQNLPNRNDSTHGAAQLKGHIAQMCAPGGSFNPWLGSVHGGTAAKMAEHLLALLLGTTPQKIAARSDRRLAWTADYQESLKLQQEAAVLVTRSKLALEHPTMSKQDLDRKAKKETPAQNSRFDTVPQGRRLAVQRHAAEVTQAAAAEIRAAARSLPTMTTATTAAADPTAPLPLFANATRPFRASTLLGKRDSEGGLGGATPAKQPRVSDAATPSQPAPRTATTPSTTCNAPPSSGDSASAPASAPPASAPPASATPASAMPPSSATPMPTNSSSPLRTEAEAAAEVAAEAARQLEAARLRETEKLLLIVQAFEQAFLDGDEVVTATLFERLEALHPYPTLQLLKETNAGRVLSSLSHSEHDLAPRATRVVALWKEQAESEKRAVKEARRVAAQLAKTEAQPPTVPEEPTEAKPPTVPEELTEAQPPKVMEVPTEAQPPAATEVPMEVVEAPPTVEAVVCAAADGSPPVQMPMPPMPPMPPMLPMPPTPMMSHEQMQRHLSHLGTLIADRLAQIPQPNTPEAAGIGSLKPGSRQAVDLLRWREEFQEAHNIVCRFKEHLDDPDVTWEPSDYEEIRSALISVSESLSSSVDGSAYTKAAQHAKSFLASGYTTRAAFAKLKDDGQWAHLVNNPHQYLPKLDAYLAEHVKYECELHTESRHVINLMKLLPIKSDVASHGANLGATPNPELLTEIATFYKGEPLYHNHKPPAGNNAAWTKATMKCCGHAECSQAFKVHAMARRACGTCSPPSGFVDASSPVHRSAGVVTRRPCEHGCMVSLRQWCRQFRAEMLVIFVFRSPEDSKTLKTQAIHFTANQAPRFLRRR